MAKRRFLKKAIAAVCAIPMAVAPLALAGCGSDKGENELWITYFKGGYGSEWVEQLARKFESENEGVKVITDPDTQLINSVANMMENGTDYDLIFCHDIAWEDFIAPGQIHCLDDMYATEVEAGVTFADRIWDEDVLASCSYNGHYYKVPWTIGTAGIAYNLTVMDRIDNWLGKSKGQEYLATENGGEDTSRRWNRTAPVDYYDLLQYCKDIVAANIDVDPDEPQSGKIVPFTWSGLSEEWQWDYVLFDWWGQLAGPETMNSFKNFGNVDGEFKLDTSKQSDPNKEVYDPNKHAVVKNADGTLNMSDSSFVGWAEFREAYELWYALVVDNKSWSSSAVSSLGKFDNEQKFAGGYAAMTPAACWVEYEAKMYLEASGQEISIMPTPIISEVKFDSNGKVLPKDAQDAAKTLDAIRAEDGVTEKTVTVDGKTYNRVSFTSSFGDSAVIPEKSTGKDLAKKFLLFMQREENAQMFTRLSGGTVLPYKYEYWNSFVENGVDKASAWQKSIFEIDRNSRKFNNYTQHPMMRNTTLKGSARMTSVWPSNNYYYFKAWNSNTDSQYNPGNLLTKLYNDEISARWNMYKGEM